jgi:uncharacterized protein
MRPEYGDVSAAFFVKLVLLWGSWLAFALLLWLVWRLAKRWGRSTRLVRTLMLFSLLACLVFIQARFLEPQLIFTRVTPIKVGFKARVALISDYHVGIYKDPAFLAQVVEKLNAMQLDAVLIAGDHSYEPAAPLAKLLAPLAQLKHPVYSVPGNHDEEMPGPPIEAVLKAALQQHGVKPIEYSHAQLASFTLVGLGDRWAVKDHLTPLQNAPKDKPIIVLMHNPDSAIQLLPGSAALVLAGHTHGGQIRIPWLYKKVIPTVHGFDRGLHSIAAVPVFVTAGLGEVGLPMRFLNPPTIDVLELY